MLKSLRERLTYASVMATLALFIALGGSSYAALKITGRDIAPRSLTGRNFKSNSVGGRVIHEKSLRPVPKARNAARLGGQPAVRFLVGCPEGTIPVSSVCVETQAHPPAPYSSAILTCAGTDNPPGRRLPTHEELATALTHQEIQLATGGELTSNVFPSGTSPGQVEDLYITNNVGQVALTPDTDAGAKSFRCVTGLTN